MSHVIIHGDVVEDYIVGRSIQTCSYVIIEEVGGKLSNFKLYGTTST